MQRAASGLYRPSARHVASRAVFSVLALIVLAGLVVGVYVWRERDVNQLREQTAQQSSDIVKLQNENATLRSGAQTNQPDDARSSMMYTSQKGVTVRVYVPLAHSKLVSPVAVLGQVPGNWSYEASFPMKLIDGNGKVIAQGAGQLLGDWMTDQLVPFSGKLTYSSSGVMHGDGSLVLQKDNPSGLAAKDDSVSVPVKL